MILCLQSGDPGEKKAEGLDIMLLSKQKAIIK
jgi:hypothetical protein